MPPLARRPGSIPTALRQRVDARSRPKPVVGVTRRLRVRWLGVCVARSRWATPDSGARGSRDQRRDDYSEESANAQADAQDERPVDGDVREGVAGAMPQHGARRAACRAAADVLAVLEAPPQATPIPRIAPSRIAPSRSSPTNACLLRSVRAITRPVSARNGAPKSTTCQARWRCSLNGMFPIGRRTPSERFATVGAR